MTQPTTIIIDLHTSTEMEFGFPVLRDGSVKVVRPDWMSAEEPTEVILNGYNWATPIMRAIADSLSQRRQLDEVELPPQVTITVFKEIGR